MEYILRYSLGMLYVNTGMPRQSRQNKFIYIKHFAQDEKRTRWVPELKQKRNTILVVSAREKRAYLNVKCVIVLHLVCSL